MIDEDSSRILSWLETSAPWHLTVQDFYEQYEFSLLDVQLPSHLSFLASAETLGSLRSSVETLLGAELGDRIDATVHKLVPGQRIRVHNDFIPGQETHRILIQLNRGWEEESGGILMLFTGENPKTLTRLIVPKNCSAFGFAISPRSYHAVSTVHSGERFTLVYSFYGRT
jgi:Rps23 Pro-64 3,4-dihydroxylase Tpa1-like proline 4-hydroxylase